MAKILILSGPTREYLDPVRFLSNGSSGRMGAALAQAALEAGNQVVVVSGPVAIEYPTGVEKLVPVTTTGEMLQAAREAFPSCDGAIAAAAPCDFRPRVYSSHKIKKDGQPRYLELVDTPDIIATLGTVKRADQWTIAFALETEDGPQRAREKLRNKNCDWIVLNRPEAIDADQTQVEIMTREGVVRTARGNKLDVARVIVEVVSKP